MIGQFSHVGSGWKIRVKFVISHRSVSIDPSIVSQIGGLDGDLCIVSQIESAW